MNPVIGNSLLYIVIYTAPPCNYIHFLSPHVNLERPLFLRDLRAQLPLGYRAIIIGTTNKVLTVFKH